MYDIHSKKNKGEWCTLRVIHTENSQWAHLIASLGEFWRYVRFTEGLNSKPFKLFQSQNFNLWHSSEWPKFWGSNLSIGRVNSNTQVFSSTVHLQSLQFGKKETRMQTFSFAFVRSLWKIVLFMLLINSLQSFIYLLSNFKRRKQKCYLPSSEQNHSVHYSVGILISSNYKLYPNFFTLRSTQITLMGFAIHLPALIRTLHWVFLGHLMSFIASQSP